MPVPNPTPEPEEKARLRALLALSTSAEVLDLVSNFDSQEDADAEWALTLEDLESYQESSEDSGDVKKIGSIEFFEDKGANYALSIVNRIRQRYGVEEITTLKPAVEIVSTLPYF